MVAETVDTRKRVLENWAEAASFTGRGCSTGRPEGTDRDSCCGVSAVFGKVDILFWNACEEVMDLGRWTCTRYSQLSLSTTLVEGCQDF